MAAYKFEKIEEYLRNLAALRYYPKVKKERDSFALQARQLKKKTVELETQLKTEIGTKNELSSALAKTRSEIDELTSRLGDAQKELSSLKEFKVKLPDAGELTLEELRAQLLHAEDEEVKRRAKEHLAALDRDMQSRMPTLVHERLIQILKCPEWPPEIARSIESTARKIADGVLGAREQWPDWFKNDYLEEVNELVNQRLTAEFERRAQVEAKKRLEQMKVGHWEEYVASKVRTLGASLKDLLNELQGTWRFHCDRCGRRVAVDVSHSDTGSLLRGETIDITCPICVDPAPFPFILSTVPHRLISLNLDTLLKLYMGDVPP